MNMIGCHHVVHNIQTKTLLGLEKPSQIPATVLGKLQQKFFLMTAACRVVAEGVA